METPVAINDYIDIGVYAKPEKGKKRGKTLLLQRRRISKPKETIEVIVKGEPMKRGLIPITS